MRNLLRGVSYVLGILFYTSTSLIAHDISSKTMLTAKRDALFRTVAEEGDTDVHST